MSDVVILYLRNDQIETLVRLQETPRLAAI
jgi:hypothetical protein